MLKPGRWFVRAQPDTGTSSSPERPSEMKRPTAPDGLEFQVEMKALFDA